MSSGYDGMLGHGDSFVWFGYPVRTTRTVKEPPVSVHFNSFRDIPQTD